MSNVVYNECLAFQNDLYNFVYRMTYNEITTEDIVQETYLKALIGINTYLGKSSLKTWLFSIARNETYRAIRNRKKDIDKINALRKNENLTNKENESNIFEQHEYYIEQVKNGCLYALISCLPFSQRCVFVLHELYEFPINDVAIIVNKSENASRILLMRSKRTIKDFLCNSCEHIAGNPTCRCANMIGFSIKNQLIDEIMNSEKIEKMKLEYKKCKNEIELIKSLPYKKIDLILQFTTKYQILFKK